MTVLLSGTAVGAVYALVAIGFILIYKGSRVLNFAQGELLMVGAFLAALTTGTGVPLLAAVLIAIVGTALVGFLIESFSMWPLVGRPVVAPIIATLGLAIVMRGVAGAVWGQEVRPIPTLFPDRPVRLLGATVSAVQVGSFAVALALIGLFVAAFRYTRLGLALRAFSSDARAANAVGISSGGALALVWMAAGAVAAAGGVLLAQSGGVSVSTADVAFRVLPVVVLGGLTSFGGAVVAGVVVGVLETAAGTYLNQYVPGGGVQEVAPYVVMLLILIVRPAGLFGNKEIRRA
ncbi:branched-chain amino acid ABC transporter permease [Pseudonocardia sp. H11422]|uniref:branched-chain amino acid ABC transporter permease n=1 Tax=Pseudonocardia sp. H11422 TaxID=2835866 RepID=UPI001BDDA331|nr:branched-chain amino acid ABC transporter permease [Pseudonocardia sp. H11422]